MRLLYIYRALHQGNRSFGDGLQGLIFNSHLGSHQFSAHFAPGGCSRHTQFDVISTQTFKPCSSGFFKGRSSCWLFFFCWETVIQKSQTCQNTSSPLEMVGVFFWLFFVWFCFSHHFLQFYLRKWVWPKF